MKYLRDVIEASSGTPQFRIMESFQKSAPTFQYYGQAELEADLAGLDLCQNDGKQIRTFDKVTLTEAGDVLFSLASVKATIVRDSHKGYLLTQNYVKLILNDDIDAKYLVYLLNEDITIKRQYQTMLQGTSILKFTLRQLNALELPKMPILKKQKIIGKLYFNQLHLCALRHRAASAEQIIILEKMRGAIR